MKKLEMKLFVTVSEYSIFKSHVHNRSLNETEAVKDMMI